MIRIKDVTPAHMVCIIGGCPAVYETDRGTLLIVGKRVQPEVRRQVPAEKVGPDEVVIEIPRDLLAALGKRQLSPTSGG